MSRLLGWHVEAASQAHCPSLHHPEVMAGTAACNQDAPQPSPQSQQTQMVLFNQTNPGKTWVSSLETHGLSKPWMNSPCERHTLFPGEE